MRTGSVQAQLVHFGRLAGMGRRSLAIIERWSFAEDVAGLRQALARVCPTIIARELRGGS